MKKRTDPAPKNYTWHTMATINFCENLYQIAKADSGRDFWMDLHGERVLLIQSLATAKQVLCSDADSFVKEMSSLRQVSGHSRVTENHRDWVELYQLSQPSLSNLNHKLLFEALDRHSLRCIEELVTSSKDALPRLNQTVLLELTTAAISEVLFNKPLKDFDPDCVSDLSVFAHLVGLNSPYSCQSDDEAKKRRFSALGDTRLRWLQRMAKIKRTISSEDTLLQRLLNGTQGKSTVGQFEYEVLMLFGAGSDTTATALSWAILLLSQYPEVQQELRRETAQYWDGSTLNNRDIMHNEPMLRFLAEVFRLYPPVPFITRRATNSVKIGDHIVRSGDQIILSMIGLGRDASVFSNPDHLDMSRGATAQCPNESTLPFSAGPRRCGGQRLAMIELPTILAHFLRHLQFDLQQAATVKFRWQVTMHCEGGVPVSVVRI